MTGESKKRPRGRPKGANNLAEPLGARRAREYHALKDAGEKPNRAAAKVAERFGVGETAIFNDAKRHEPRLAAEALREAEAIMHELRDKAAGLVNASDLDKAWQEALSLIHACVERRLTSEALVKALVGATEAEAREYLSNAMDDARLELAHHFAERAHELPRLTDGDIPYANAARLVFERFAERLKPKLK